MRKTIKEAARDYTAKDREAEIENNNGSYNDQQSYFAFLAGHAYALEQASGQSFVDYCTHHYGVDYESTAQLEEDVNVNEIDFDDLTCFWGNAKLSAQKEIEHLKLISADHSRAMDSESDALKKLAIAVRVIERFIFAHKVGGERDEYIGAYADAEDFIKQIGEMK